MDLDKRKAAKLANFIKFAYHMYSVGGLTPPADPGIAATGYELVYYLNASDFEIESFYGYIARSKFNPGDLVLVIRGTEDTAEWILDFLAIPIPFTPSPSAGHVALGFLRIYDSFKLIDTTGVSFRIKQAIAQLVSTSPITSFTVLGHSLGAALATLAAADLAMNKVCCLQDVLTLCTFASPRVGLLDFAASFNNAVKTSYRIWNTLDIVPAVPPHPYLHVSGNGSAIVQSQQQLATLAFTVDCEHALNSYQWMLDEAVFSLNPACTKTAHLALTASAPQTVLTASATVSYRAIHGHL
ncbi:lipase family protein [Chitinimonas sp. BJB300]|uniref:lipase family protein n=1 Tax=Chitinimonas sp. BJB300 TaxID=1559339 RepID=UPI000C0E5012|nr:lipase family protein [Chitinimonas sp. BJB300]PHV09759.1 hypothetical protein CSQ89_19905 [Chitinimonas sp. BJB300]TSJ84541.1 lipase family protein [Chitinimonas sp. BJB300]